MRAEIVRHDGGSGDRRGRAQIRPADGLDRSAVDRSAHVPFAAAVLRQNTIVAPAQSENVGDGVLPHVPGRQNHPGRRLPAFGAALVHRLGRHVGNRLVDRVVGPRYHFVRRDHAFVRNATVPIIIINRARFMSLIINNYHCGATVRERRNYNRSFATRTRRIYGPY